MVNMASGMDRGRVGPTTKNNEDYVAQYGGDTPNNRLTDMQSWFTVYFFDIGHPCYGHLTPVKTGIR